MTSHCIGGAVLSLALFVGASATAQEQGEKPGADAGPPITEERIREALEERVALEFVDTPLADAIAFIRDLLNIEFRFDIHAITDEGIATDEPVNFTTRGMRLKNALDAVLRPHGLIWVVRDAHVLITIQIRADGLLDVRVYDVADLVAARDAKGELVSDFAPLMQVIQESSNELWSDINVRGGTMAQLAAPGLRVLVVRQTDRAHDEIRSLLEKLRDLRQGDAPELDLSAPLLRESSYGPYGHGYGGAGMVPCPPKEGSPAKQPQGSGSGGGIFSTLPASAAP